jgi:hypothetical protein
MLGIGVMELLILLVFFAVLGVGGIFASVAVFLMVKQTIDREGRWGFNLQPLVCPRCGAKATTVRRPANLSQAVWGGWTCHECGTELDEWGRPTSPR